MGVSRRRVRHASTSPPPRRQTRTDAAGKTKGEAPRAATGGRGANKQVVLVPRDVVKLIEDSKQDDSDRRIWAIVSCTRGNVVIAAVACAVPKSLIRGGDPSDLRQADEALAALAPPVPGARWSAAGTADVRQLWKDPVVYFGKMREHASAANSTHIHTVRVVFQSGRVYRARVGDGGEKAGTWFAATCCIASNAPNAFLWQRASSLPAKNADSAPLSTLLRAASRSDALARAVCEARSGSALGARRLLHHTCCAAAAHALRKHAAVLRSAAAGFAETRLVALLCADVALGWMAAYAASRAMESSIAKLDAPDVYRATSALLARIDDHVLWLMDAPAGLKQNRELAYLLGAAVLRVIACLHMTVRWTTESPTRFRWIVLALLRFGSLAAMFGMSALSRVAVVGASLIAAPIALCFDALLALLIWQMWALRRMWALVRQSHSTDGEVVVEKLVAGSLLLAPCVLLLPTTATFALAAFLPAALFALTALATTLILDKLDAIVYANAEARRASREVALSRGGTFAWLEPCDCWYALRA